MKVSGFILLETVLAATLGLVVSLLLSRWSQTLLSAIHESSRITRSLLLFQLFCGATTGTFAIGRSSDEAAIICVVATLLVIQLPLDMFTRRLSRTVTAGAFVSMLAIVSLRMQFREEGEETLTSLLLSVVIVGVFAALHFVSPNSLGFGDVLLAAPLAMAVTSSSAPLGIVWLAVSSSSGAVHGLFNRIRYGRRDLPFGPHLLVAAWALLIVGV